VRRFILVVVSLWALGARSARAQSGPPSLGPLERESVTEEMTRLGLGFEAHPEGKTIGSIQVVNEEVFSRHDWWFQFLNHFHRTTRDWALARELLMRPGDPYDQALVDESIRNLQTAPATVAGTGPELSSVVAIVPIVSRTPGVVDLLVVTRDLWSLRFNTNFDLQQNTLALLVTSMSENNLFGWRKYVAANFLLDQGRYGFGGTYLDPNVSGTRLQLYTSALLWYGREADTYEGNFELFSVRYPFYSLATRWGGGVDLSHDESVQRQFLGTALRGQLVDGVVVPYAYRQKITAVDPSVTRSFGLALIQRVTLGYFFSSRRFEVLPGFPGDAQVARDFLDAYAPVSEQRSEPYVRYHIFTARYVVYRDLDTFDLREHRQMGPSLNLRAGYGIPALGADFRALSLAAIGAWAVGWRGGYGSLTVGAETRVRDGSFIDRLLSAEVFAASPIIQRAGRLLVDAEIDGTAEDTQRRLFFVGGRAGLGTRMRDLGAAGNLTGLRGYAIGEFEGTEAIIGHVEARSVPLPVYSQRFGTLLFYDVGGAAMRFSDVVLYHDAGVGLRWLIPQLNSSVVRIDWAFAMQSTPYTRAGFPGRFTAGFQQLF
jgi:hypothetical protein